MEARLNLRLFSQGLGSLLFDDFDNLTRIATLFKLQNEVFRFHRIPLIVEDNGTGDPLEVFQLSDGSRDFSAAGFLASIGLQSLFDGFDADQGRVVPIHGEGLYFLAEALFELLGESRAFGIGIRWPRHGSIVAA